MVLLRNLNKSTKLGILVLVILSILLFVPVAFSDDFSVTYKAIDNDVFPDEVGTYEVYIKNTDDKTIDVRFLFTDQSSWRVRTEKLTDLSTIEIKPGETATSIVIVKPLAPYNYGSSLIPVTIVSGDETRKSFDVNFFLRNPLFTTGYIPSINVDIDLPNPFDPREDDKVIVTLRSKNQLDLRGLIIKVDSDIYKAEKMVDLEPFGKVTAEFEMNIPHNASPQDDILNVEVYYVNNSYARDRKSFVIEPYASIEETKTLESSFLKKKTIIHLENNGNAVGKTKYMYPVSSFSRIFTFTDPNANFENVDDNSYYTWDLEIQKGEVVELNVVVNYRPHLVVLLLLIIGVICYYIFRSPIIIKKEAIPIHGNSGYKILLHMKNRTKKVVDNVIVIDKVPPMLNVIRKFPVGTLHPSKIVTHDKKGTMLKWELPVLESYEERILTYHIDSKLELVGQFNIGSAIIKFKGRKGKIQRIKSNGLRL